MKYKVMYTAGAKKDLRNIFRYISEELLAPENAAGQAELYSIGLTKFQELAKEAKAVYKIDKVALVNCEIFEKYLDTFRIA